MPVTQLIDLAYETRVHRADLEVSAIFTTQASIEADLLQAKNLEKLLFYWIEKNYEVKANEYK